MAGSDRDSRIVERYLSGRSSTEIAKEFNLSQVSISRIVRSAGVTRSASEGKRLSHSRPEVKAKMSSAAKGRKCPEHVKEVLRARTGPNNHNWRSGLTVTAQGYLSFTSSPSNGDLASKHLHRVIASWKIGRSLSESEHVHHIDGNKLNNDPKNLMILSPSEHARLHAIKSGLGTHPRKKKHA